MIRLTTPKPSEAMLTFQPSCASPSAGMSRREAVGQRHERLVLVAEPALGALGDASRVVPQDHPHRPGSRVAVSPRDPAKRHRQDNHQQGQGHQQRGGRCPKSAVDQVADSQERERLDRRRQRDQPAPGHGSPRPEAHQGPEHQGEQRHIRVDPAGRRRGCMPPPPSEGTRYSTRPVPRHPPRDQVRATGGCSPPRRPSAPSAAPAGTASTPES